MPSLHTERSVMFVAFSCSTKLLKKSHLAMQKDDSQHLSVISTLMFLRISHSSSSRWLCGEWLTFLNVNC